MNRKFIILSVIVFCSFLLSACSKQLSEPYDASKFESKELLANEITEVRGKGFAADLCVPETDGDSNTDGVNAEAFALFDKDGKTVLSQKNIYEKVYPASTTKIMTCLLALELCDPEETVTVPKEAEIDVSGSSMASLKPGDQLKMKDLLYALMVPSGNDAAVAIATHISGSVEEFAKLMNQRAAQLGATGTHFVNPHGLPDEDHYTTVYDMYLIFQEALKFDEFRKVSSAKEKTVTVKDTEGQERQITWTSGNGFYNGKYSLPGGLEYVAGKTGHTNAAGFCLVLGETDQDGKECISIIMKAPIYEDLYNGMVHLTGKYFL